MSMHHRIRRDLRKRLKLAALDAERPATDCVNEAIENWLGSRADVAQPSALAEISGATTLETVEWLREKRSDGVGFAAASALPKETMVAILSHFGETADLRMSADRLVSEIVRRL